MLLLALNDRIADGRDVSWIWDVDYETVLPHAARVVCSGTRAADIALRAKYAGVDATRIEIVPGRADALDRALERAGAGGTAYVLPTYTAMLELQRVAAERGLVRPYWEAPRRDHDRPRLPRAPVDLRRPRQRPRAASSAAPGAASSTASSRSRSATTSIRAAPT